MINCGLAGSGATGRRLTIRTRGASPVDPSPRCAFQIRASQICTTEIDIVQPRILEVGTDQVPARQVQIWDTTAFLDYWVSEFNTDPPNAVISADSEAAITINSPKISGDTVTFTATPLSGQTLPIDIINQPTLFIDVLAASNCPWAVAPIPGSGFVSRCVPSAT